MAHYKIAGGWQRNYYRLAIHPPVRESWLLDRINSQGGGEIGEYIVSDYPDCTELSFEAGAVIDEERTSELKQSVGGVLLAAGYQVEVIEEEVVLDGVGSVFEQIARQAAPQ